MPLSDSEQKLLEQMERALYAEDPKFASAMRGANRRPGAGRRVVVGSAGIVFGLALLVFAIGPLRDSLVVSILVGGLGFVCMLAGTAYAVSSQRKGPNGVVTAAGTVRPAAKSTSRNRGTFMQRLEQRWERRRDER